MPTGNIPPYGQIAGTGILTGVVQIDDPDFVAFTENPQGIGLNVIEIEAN